MSWKKIAPGVLLLLWLGTVTSLSLLPVSSIPLARSLWDKLEHASAYGMLTLLGGWVLSRYLTPAWRAWLLAALGAVSYGALMEGAQALCHSGRHAERGDIVANAVGAGAVLLAYLTARLLAGLWGVVGDRKERHG